MSTMMSGFCGGLACGIQYCISYPLEYLKTVMQLNKEWEGMGFKNVTRYIYRNKGYFGLYSGFNSVVTFAIPEATVRFGGFDFAQAHLFTSKSKFDNFLCGIFAGVTSATFIVTPQETIKTKLVYDRL